MTLSFTYSALPGRVVFGVGSLDKLPEEVKRLGIKRALVLATPPQREQAMEIAGRLGELSVGVYDKAVMHVPVETAKAARDEVRRLNVDGTVAVGGGSTTGLAKAIALELGTPIIAVPTTYAGSEMTPIWGMTEGGIKTTGRDQKVLPKTVIYDPSLLTTLPADTTAASGMNAIAHCIEALYAHDGNPIIAMMAEDGIRAVARSLKTAVQSPKDMDARSDTLYGAWLAGTVLGATSMALHHKICHTLGGFNLPHAEVHTIVLPHAAAYNAGAAPEAMARAARALGVASGKDVPGALYDLAKSCGAKMALAEVGMRAEDIDRATEIALKAPYPNPRPLERNAIHKLLDDAFNGRRPS
ncbi:MAG TPA: maleylacetate reductase [Magnetospirillaceae bacterium]|jgi:maleylacetate reductase